MKVIGVSERGQLGLLDLSCGIGATYREGDFPVGKVEQLCRVLQGGARRIPSILRTEDNRRTSRGVRRVFALHVARSRTGFGLDTRRRWCSGKTMDEQEYADTGEC